MPLWLWQEVQALPWSTEIVALTCGTQNCLRPYSSVHGKLVVQHRPKTKNVGTLPPLSSLNFLTIRHHSTARRSSSFPPIAFHPARPYAALTSRLHRNSVPSTQTRSFTTSTRP